MNRDLHFVAHKLICFCAMLMKFMEILVSQGGSQGASQGLKLFSQVIWPGAPWCRAATGLAYHTMFVYCTSLTNCKLTLKSRYT